MLCLQSSTKFWEAAQVQAREWKGEEVVRWWMDPVKQEALEDYCITDVDTEHAAAQVLDPIPEKELEGWRMDQRINDYGFEVDQELASKALALVKPATQYTNGLLKKVSGRIINEVRGINRVAYDVSSKPPATIEWE